MQDESAYLRGKIRVASGETGHNPNISRSNQAQGPSFLQYVAVEERSQREWWRFTAAASECAVEWQEITSK